ncbi:head-tail connector protein [Sinisalibacter aestuarii]|uniref:Phage gp6-like head-tail connector protein n=1 Tax=Sinisalibacter aestuarii TaxID=2949426 RepID=A0ABQ5LVV7_9RHOB|nr:hypothetical protein [Sinisalibacter aestuarii]GKY88728.1 hypothetical protein STA1M1_25970 [Sinisalibacter aestuarii]
MMLTEQTPVPGTALPVAQFKDHLRLGTGFADDGVQDEVLDAYLRAALASVEARTGKALIARSFSWSVTAWRDLARQVLPVAPVRAITGLSILDRHDQEEAIASTRYRLETDLHRPALVAAGLSLPVIPVGGRAVIGFEAGFGPDWQAVPADLAQAVLLLAAQFYENRGTGAGEALPQAAQALMARWRNVRLFGGGAA